MFRLFVGLGAFLAALAPAILIAAQHEGMPGMQQNAQGATPQLVAACVQSQQQVMAAADAANRRLEIARQTNQPAALRAAMDDLQSVLSAMKTQLAPCAEMQAAAVPAAGQGHDTANMAGGNSANVPASSAPVSDPHAGHVMPNEATSPAAPAPPPANRPAAPKPSTPNVAPPSATTRAQAPAAAPKMVMVMTATDPAKLQCSPKIDVKAAAKTTYKGKTYYFCSAKDRDEFVTDPEMSLSMRPPL